MSRTRALHPVLLRVAWRSLPCTSAAKRRSAGIKTGRVPVAHVITGVDDDLDTEVQPGRDTEPSRHRFRRTDFIGQHLELAGPKVSVVIPTLNEAQNLPYVFAALPPGLFEVIVVDGRSTDGTVERAQQLRPDVRIVLEGRHGKGSALARGCAAALGDIIVLLDADGSADPREIPAFVEALLDGADFAKGSRNLPGAGSADITRIRGLGNRCLGGLVNVLFGTRYTDLCYGYNAFWRGALEAMTIDCDGFEVETLINIRVARAGLEVREIPSFEHRRIHGVSNLNAMRDGMRVLRTILRERARKKPQLAAAVAGGHRITPEQA
ncbi:MAG: glycosyltransferase family 2 protein [Actinobacteria bacterium]|nr:glycosyltransferase family 2 protein [Actinomycetota bacterium]